jgi:predicted dehydrogenase
MPEARSRRAFLKTTGVALSGAAMGWPAASYARIAGANERVRVGVVGFSDRFRSALAPAFMEHAEKLNFELVAVSDIWNKRREEGVAFLQKLNGKAPAACRNNEELYARKDVDAVMVATADFQHAYHAIEAVKAGRDAYVEKPLAHTMEDARAVRKAVQESKQVVQIGTQRRSSPEYQRAYEYIKSGKFGEIVSAEMTWNVNQPGRWRRPALVAGLHEQDTDWKRFLIDRPAVEFDARKYVEYRLFWPYSSGIPDQWMVHQIDTVHWFTGLPRPRSVVANGGIYLWRDGRTNWDTMTAVFDYGPLTDASKGFQVVYSSRMTNSAGGVKEIYFSNGGTLDLDKHQITAGGGLEQNFAREMNMQANLLKGESLAEKNAETDTRANAGSDVATSNNVRNWMECVRSRAKTNADIEAGYNHSVALCMCVTAIQTGRRVTFDDAAQRVVVS